MPSTSDTCWGDPITADAFVIEHDLDLQELRLLLQAAASRARQLLQRYTPD